MTLVEMNNRLKTVQITDENEYFSLHEAYIVFDLEKDEFCKVVDTVGVELLVARAGYYKRLLKAERELKDKEEYLQAKARMEDINKEKDDLKKVIQKYESGLNKTN